MLDYNRIYGYRFKDVDVEKKIKAWRVIAEHIYRAMGSPSSLLDPAAGSCEFINNVPAADRWAVDMSPASQQCAADGVRFICGNSLEVELPENYFQGIFASNFLEHLLSHVEVGAFLQRMYRATAPGGVICIMGPNFKYCAKDYFDCADHSLALTHISVAEHLYSAGYEIEKNFSKFLPFSFRSKLPPSPFLIRSYLDMPLAWKALGKQFLVIGKKPATSLKN